MGCFYTNITLRTSDMQRVAEALRRASRTALIAPPEHGFTVVFDEASETQDVDALKSLALYLSRACTCPTLAVLNHDDDVLVYLLYDGSQLVDEYTSAPGYFDDADADSPPSGGDARRLVTLLGTSASSPDVERILRTPSGDDAFVFATVRHRDLVQALGLPTSSVGTGFTYLEKGEVPDGLDMATLQRV